MANQGVGITGVLATPLTNTTSNVADFSHIEVENVNTLLFAAALMKLAAKSNGVLQAGSGTSLPAGKFRDIVGVLLSSPADLAAINRQVAHFNNHTEQLRAVALAAFYVRAGAGDFGSLMRTLDVKRPAVPLVVAMKNAVGLGPAAVLNAGYLFALRAIAGDSQLRAVTNDFGCIVREMGNQLEAAKIIFSQMMRAEVVGDTVIFPSTMRQMVSPMRIAAAALVGGFDQRVSLSGRERVSAKRARQLLTRSGAVDPKVKSLMMLGSGTVVEEDGDDSNDL